MDFHTNILFQRVYQFAAYTVFQALDPARKVVSADYCGRPKKVVLIWQGRQIKTLSGGPSLAAWISEALWSCRNGVFLAGSVEKNTKWRAQFGVVRGVEIRPYFRAFSGKEMEADFLSRNLQFANFCSLQIFVVCKYLHTSYNKAKKTFSQNLKLGWIRGPFPPTHHRPNYLLYLILFYFFNRK